MQEGLTAASRLDPAERERAEVFQWLNHCIDTLNIQLPRVHNPERERAELFQWLNHCIDTLNIQVPIVHNTERERAEVFQWLNHYIMTPTTYRYLLLPNTENKNVILVQLEKSFVSMKTYGNFLFVALSANAPTRQWCT